MREREEDLLERRLLGAHVEHAIGQRSDGGEHLRGVAFDGTHLWVTNQNGSSVTELNASNGSWVRTLSGGSYGFNHPEGVAFDGTHLWAANVYGDSVTEIFSH